ncbi:MAG: PTS sugar transporter subunit IIB [Spirochaetaceae bacterium]|jgi:PTS system mannose-specific IIB component|nr:PTS sugar transporter subunit IIB [Spirochaetaceae bacterium]
MIKHLRIDNRLIHGQVAVGWQKYIDAKAIIICNDKVAADPIQKMALPLAARGSKVLVYTLAETLQYEKDHPDESIFVIAKFPQDALDILKSGVKVETINVGNAAPIAGTKYVMVTKSIAATAEDAVIYRQIAELNGGKLTSQIMTSMETMDFLAALKKAGF